MEYIPVRTGNSRLETYSRPFFVIWIEARDYRSYAFCGKLDKWVKILLPGNNDKSFIFPTCVAMGSLRELPGRVGALAD